jgi:hypothetical protein
MATSRPSILHKFVSNPPSSSPYGRVPAKRAASKSDDSAGGMNTPNLSLSLSLHHFLSSEYSHVYVNYCGIQNSSKQAHSCAHTYHFFCSFPLIMGLLTRISLNSIFRRRFTNVSKQWDIMLVILQQYSHEFLKRSFFLLVFWLITGEGSKMQMFLLV